MNNSFNIGTVVITEYGVLGVIDRLVDEDFCMVQVGQSGNCGHRGEDSPDTDTSSGAFELHPFDTLTFVDHNVWTLTDMHLEKMRLQLAELGEHRHVLTKIADDLMFHQIAKKNEIVTLMNRAYGKVD